MKHPLPYPFAKYLPQLLQKTMTPEGEAVCRLFDHYIAKWLKEAIELKHLHSVERCPVEALDLLGEYLRAELKAGDSERTKRIKLAEAKKVQKHRYSFERNIKIRIEAATGYSCRKVDMAMEGGIVFFGDLMRNYLGPNYSTFGTRRMLFLGSDMLSAKKGNIYIEIVGIGGLVDTDKKRIVDIAVESIARLKPAYYILHFGYLVQDNFIILRSMK